MIAHRPEPDLDVSGLEINSEVVTLIVLSLALETHNFALSRGIPSVSVESQLELVFGVLDCKISDLLDFGNVAAIDATCVGGISVRFSNIGYRSVALATKNAMAVAFDRDANV